MIKLSSMLNRPSESSSEEMFHKCALSIEQKKGGGDNFKLKGILSC